VVPSHPNRLVAETAKPQDVRHSAAAVAGTKCLLEGWVDCVLSHACCAVRAPVWHPLGARVPVLCWTALCAVLCFHSNQPK
jgi:hypothetical protein